MPLQLRRGLNADRATTTFAEGEPIWTTDTTKLYVGDGVTPGGIAVAGNQNINTNSNVTFNSAVVSTTATVATLKFGDGTTMTTAATGGASTSTFYNLTVTNRISFNTASTYIQTFTDGSIYSLDIKAPNGIGIDGGVAVSIIGQLEVDNIANNNAGFITMVDPTTFSQTATIQQLSIGLNNGAVTITGAVSSATSMLVQTNAASGGNIFFNMNRFGVAHPIAFTRSGAILLESGQSIAPGFSGGLEITAETGMNVNINSGNANSGLVADDSAGAQLTTYNAGLDALNIAVLDMDGLFTAPSLAVSSTATVASLVVTNTATIEDMSIGLNNGAVTITGAVSSATSMLVQTNPASGGNIFFNMNRFGVAHPIAFTRSGAILLESGQLIGPAFGGGMNINAEADMNVNINSGNFNAGFTADDTLGAQLITYNVGLDAPNIATLDPYGVFTTPALSVSSTATVNELSVTTSASAASLSAASLSVTNTATVNEVVVGPDLNAIKSQSYNTLGVDNNWRVGNVLEVGTGGGQGYVTSTGANNLKLQTNGNNGPGGSIDIQYGDGAGVGIYSGTDQAFQTANFSTTSNTINYGLTVNGPATFTSPTTLAVFTATGLTAISGAVGQIAIVSNSAGGAHPNGMMAFWDTTNGRWSYVHDNTAV